MGFEFFLLIHIWLVSAENDPCGDFYKFACTEKNQGKNDGTGSVRETDQLERQLLTAMQTEVPQVERAFDELLARRPDLQQKISDDAGCWFNRTTKCESYNAGVAEIRGHFAGQFSSTNGLENFFKQALPFSTYSFFWNDLEIINMMNTAQSRVDQRLVPIERRNYVRDTLFPQVRAAMDKVLQGLPDGPQKQKIRERLQRVTIVTEDCELALLDPNAYYDPSRGTDGEVMMCLSMLYRTDSLFSAVFLLSHELAHSIDPCNNPSEAFSGVTQCLSRHRSLGVRNRASSAPGGTPMCEAVCDWMAAEVTAELIQTPGHALNRNNSEVALGIANRFPVCEFSPLYEPRQEGAAHPRIRDRIEFGASQPMIRQRIGCTNHSQQTYCPLNGLPPNSENPPPLGPNGVAQ